MTNRLLVPAPITKQQLEKALLQGSPEVACKALVDAVAFIDDYQWLLSHLTEVLANFDDQQINRTAIVCLGQLARTNAGADKEELAAVLAPHILNPQLRGAAEDALDDVRMYLGGWC